MVSWLHKWKWWILGALAVVAVFAATGFHASVLPEFVADKCRSEYQANHDYCSTYRVSGAWLGVFGAWLKDSSAIIATASGVFVAAFTATLWWSTKQLWLSSERAISAAREDSRLISRAYVHMKSVRFIEYPNTIKWTFFVENSGDTPCHRFELGALVQIGESKTTIEQPADSALTFKGWSALPRRRVHSTKHEPDYPDGVESVLGRKMPDQMVFVSGTIKYETIFGERYRSEFSFFSNRKGEAGVERKGDNTSVGTRMSRTTGRLSVFEEDAT